MDEYIDSRVISGICNLQLPQDMKITLNIAERIRDCKGCTEKILVPRMHDNCKIIHILYNCLLAGLGKPFVIDLIYAANVIIVNFMLDSEGIEITCLLVDFDVKSYCKRYDLIHTRKYFVNILESVYGLKLDHCDYGFSRRHKTTATLDVNTFSPDYRN